MFKRMLGVLKLNVANFEEIEKDPNATLQAAIIVILSALLTGAGSGLLAGFTGGNGLTRFIGTVVWAFISWFIWAAATWFVGTRLFKGQADLGEMLRVIGYAYTPLFLSIIPCIGGLIGGIWALAAGFIAVRQGLDLDDMKTLLTVAIGFAIVVVGNLIIGVII
jgi:hypothetical protein